MELFLRLVAQRQVQSIKEYLLVPNLAPEQLYSFLYSAVTLAALWRLRRERPYVVAFQEKQTQFGNNEDLHYAQSLPQLQMSSDRETKAVLYVGQGDITAFLPSSEDDFLLFLPEPPTSIIPYWPDMITKSNGLIIGQSDEFIKLQTSDPTIMALVECLPTANQLFH